MTQKMAQNDPKMAQNPKMKILNYGKKKNNETIII